MKNSSVLTPQLVFWGICLIVLCWLSATLLFEVHLGWPANSVQWLKRALGWGVEFWLVQGAPLLPGHSRKIVRTQSHLLDLCSLLVRLDFAGLKGRFPAFDPSILIRQARGVC